MKLGKSVWHRKTGAKGVVICIFKRLAVRVLTSQGRQIWKPKEYRRG